MLLRAHRGAILFILTLFLCFGSGCKALRRFAIKQLASSLTEFGCVFESDSDPDLVREALPFTLKLVEAMLIDAPTNSLLLLKASSGYTQYAYGFLVQEADRLEQQDFERAEALRDRARGLLFRGRDYALRGLELSHPGVSAALHQDPIEALSRTRKGDVPFLYWAAAAWGAAISISKDRPELIADQRIVEALLDRTAELDESFENGAVLQALIAYEMVRQGAIEPPEARARRRFEKAVALSQGKLAGPYVTFAESVSIATQNRAEFVALLETALAIDTNAEPKYRMVNLIMQQRARWLLARVDELFLE